MVAAAVPLQSVAAVPPALEAVTEPVYLYGAKKVFVINGDRWVIAESAEAAVAKARRWWEAGELDVCVPEPAAAELMPPDKPFSIYNEDGFGDAADGCECDPEDVYVEDDYRECGCDGLRRKTLRAAEWAAKGSFDGEPILSAHSVE